MSLLPNLVQIIKKAALEAVEASNPANVVFGTVLSANPLSIRVDQKIILTEEFLVRSRNVTDYETEATIVSQGRERIIIHNALAVGDKVILMKMQGGQKYVVMDKVGD